MRIMELLGHTSSIEFIQISPDGLLLISVSEDRTIGIWDIETTECIDDDLWEGINCACFSPDVEYLLCGDDDGNIIWFDICDFNNFKIIQTGHHSGVLTFCFSPDGKYLIVTTNQGLLLFDAKTLKHIDHMSVEYRWIYSTCFSLDGKYLVSGSADGFIRILDTETLTTITTIKKDDSIRYVQFSPDGKYLMSSNGHNIIRMWDSETWECIWDSNNYKINMIYSVNFIPNGNFLLNGSYLFEKMTIDTDSSKYVKWECREKINDPFNNISCSQLNSKYLVNGLSDGRIRIYNMI